MDSILTIITIDADDNYEKNKGRKNMKVKRSMTVGLLVTVVKNVFNSATMTFTALIALSLLG
jgi:hypothetical protein